MQDSQLDGLSTLDINSVFFVSNMSDVFFSLSFANLSLGGIALGMVVVLIFMIYQKKHFIH